MGAQVDELPPSAMWLGGGIDRAKWFKTKLKEGQLLEGAVRDDGGKAQGTVLVRVLTHLTTGTDGHCFKAAYVSASDPHYRWWMDEGPGKKLRGSALYHTCEGSAVDCEFTQGRSKVIHLERFRIIGPKEWASEIPSWAFKGACRGDVEAFDLALASGKGETMGAVALPWAEAEEEEPSPSDYSSSSEEVNTAEKIKDLRRQLKALEEAAVKEKKKGKTRSSKAKAEHDPKGGIKKKRKDPSPSKEVKRKKSSTKDKDRKKPKDVDSGSGDGKAKKKRKKKRKLSPSGDDAEDEQDHAVFEAGGTEDLPSAKKRGDRGPFGTADPISFGQEDSEDSEDSQGQVFREAPAQPKTNQQSLISYSRRKPGRLAARLLLKMRDEVAMGSAGANMEESGKTPAVAVQFYLSILQPQLGSRMNLRTQRELRTLFVALDLLARSSPGRAADVICQRVKALERSVVEGHWQSAQHLELIPSETGTMLEREEEVPLGSG